MDTKSFLIECAMLTVELYTSYCVYKLYKRNAECLKALKEAQCFEIDSKLQNKVEKNGGSIEYAAVSGSIKGLSFPLRSQHIPDLKGVIQEKIIRYHQFYLSPYFGSLRSDYDIQHLINDVPFALCSKTTSLFKRGTVEVIQPLTAQGLVLPIIYDKFTPHLDTINDAVVTFTHGERMEGFREIERMLCEGETLTAVGKLVIENNQLKIKRPDNGFKYFLTHLSIESLINKVRACMTDSKIQFIITGTLTFALFLYISRHAFLIIKRKIIRNQEKKTIKVIKKIKKNE